MVEDLENRILWEDGDYALGDVFLDLPPDERRERMQQAGIDDEYFLALAPDPTEAQLEAIRATLRDLCRDGATG